mgnify:CR=1 FL=1
MDTIGLAALLAALDWPAWGPSALAAGLATGLAVLAAALVWLPLRDGRR